MKDFHTVVSQECRANTASFWKAIEIWLMSPHLINRKISASVQISLHKLSKVDHLKILDWFLNIDDKFLTIENCKEAIAESLKENQLDNCLESCESLGELDYSENNGNIVYIRLAKLLPRYADKSAQTLELSLIDIRNSNITYLFHKYDKDKKSLGFDHPYQIKYESKIVSISVQCFDKWKDDQILSWLKVHFFSKLLKWIENEAPKNSLITGSLKLISSEKYTDLYNELKLKYGVEMIKIWPENTDPLKFVYEDVAIATYLLLLWQLERERLKITEKQSFLDLGCGNGLLVHILNSEGHPGLGIDLRRRKIWDLYPATTKLQVWNIILILSNVITKL